MNFFRKKEQPEISKLEKPELEQPDNIEKGLFVDEKLIKEQDGRNNEEEKEFGPDRTPEEKNKDRQELLKLVKKYSEDNIEENKEWTKKEIEKLEEEIDEKLDKQKPQ